MIREFLIRKGTLYRRQSERSDKLKLARRETALLRACGFPEATPALWYRAKSRCDPASFLGQKLGQIFGRSTFDSEFDDVTRE
jgi:hypothetical protein